MGITSKTRLDELVIKDTYLASPLAELVDEHRPVETLTEHSGKVVTLSVPGDLFDLFEAGQNDQCARRPVLAIVPTLLWRAPGHSCAHTFRGHVASLLRCFAEQIVGLVNHNL